MQCAKFVTLQLLRAYKWAISPMFPPACRYVPTCSEYAMEAVERYGAVRGGWMALTAILRCHPFAGSGYDPGGADDGGKHLAEVRTSARQEFDTVIKLWPTLKILNRNPARSAGCFSSFF